MTHLCAHSCAHFGALAALTSLALFALPGCSNDAPAKLADAPLAAKKKPNILYIMADDLGYSDIHAFGGEIDTPNLDALVQSGHVLTNHHTGTVCAITRAMLISGTDHHLVGEGTMGVPNDERAGLPGYEGYLNDSALSVAQLLKDAGYHTYMAGKWHIGSGIVGVNKGGKTPDQWGFERSYALLGGAAGNHFTHETADSKNFTEDGKYVQPGATSPSFYSTDFFTQKLIAYIDSAKADGKPFFAYAAYTTPHWPLQVPAPWLHKYQGRYDAGYEAVRAARIARQKQLGIIPQDFTPYPGAPEALTQSSATANYNMPNAQYINAVNTGAKGYVDYGRGRVNKSWASLSPLERKAQARYMEIYAGMVENLDHNIGRLIQHLKDIGEYENTFIMFQSDNGAEGNPVSGAADPKAADEANAVEPAYSALGTDNGQQTAKRLQYGLRWAEVSAAPFRQVKGYMGEGGVATPLIVRLPGQNKPGGTHRALTHVTDNTATFLALAGVTPPLTPAPAAVDAKGVDRNKGKVVYRDRAVYPVTGRSLLGYLRNAGIGQVRSEPLGEESYGRGFVFSGDGKWKLLWTEPPVGPVDGHWELFDVTRDRGETRDVAAAHPAIVSELTKQWEAYMARVGGVEPRKPPVAN